MPPCHGGDQGFESPRGRFSFINVFLAFYLAAPLNQSIKRLFSGHRRYSLLLAPLSLLWHKVLPSWLSPFWGYSLLVCLSCRCRFGRIFPTQPYFLLKPSTTSVLLFQQRHCRRYPLIARQWCRFYQQLGW